MADLGTFEDRSGVLTLTGGTVDTVTLVKDETRNIEVVNIDGADLIAFRTDGLDPTVGGGEGDYIVPPAIGASLKVPAGGQVGDDLTVLLIAATPVNVQVGVA